MLWSFTRIQITGMSHGGLHGGLKFTLQEEVGRQASISPKLAHFTSAKKGKTDKF